MELLELKLGFLGCTGHFFLLRWELCLSFSDICITACALWASFAFLYSSSEASFGLISCELENNCNTLRREPVGEGLGGGWQKPCISF